MIYGPYLPVFNIRNCISFQKKETFTAAMKMQVLAVFLSSFTEYVWNYSNNNTNSKLKDVGLPGGHFVTDFVKM